ncbi:histidine kinase [Lachnospiraceae bacterium MD1]|uniref:histidine kinase n=1 Tax=Variimorphobacter saccharofermentans TaxID=2755051 RepID=A0A839JZ20_9FIRM|nr:ATP-binding protein [Variimorphobacter saccharofermentans]MBB2181889.1 histidine kinase [Variimorphobacter saccharofermentans]
MINKIRHRFILFTMLIISIVLGFVILLVSLGSKSAQPIHRLFISAFVIILIVCAASILLANTAIKPIKKSWQQQLDFTADASHELRTPLAIIQSNLEIIMENQYETVESQEKWLNNVLYETKRMAKLVDDLMTLSRADSKQLNLQFAEFPMDLILNERINSFSAIAKANDIHIESDITPNLTFNGDVNRITQLFTILFDNGVKYMGRPGTIHVSAYLSGKHIHVDIKDDGVGIPAEEVEKVFYRFYRLEKSRTHTQPGSGLGLSIAKWIVEAHNGKISVHSDINLGFEVSIVF